jgi:hypothetical protein
VRLAAPEVAQSPEVDALGWKSAAAGTRWHSSVVPCDTPGTPGHTPGIPDASRVAAGLSQGEASAAISAPCASRVESREAPGMAGASWIGGGVPLADRFGAAGGPWEAQVASLASIQTARAVGPRGRASAAARCASARVPHASIGTQGVWPGVPCVSP